MASGAVHAAVMARLASFTTAPVYEPNTRAEAPADGSAFVLLQYPVADETPISVGAPGQNVYREEGAIRFAVHVPRDAGLTLANSLCGELRALFRNARFGGVQCFNATPPILNDDNDDGAWCVVSCSVAYEYDLLA